MGRKESVAAKRIRRTYEINLGLRVIAAQQIRRFEYFHKAVKDRMPKTKFTSLVRSRFVPGDPISGKPLEQTDVLARMMKPKRLKTTNRRRRDD